MFAGVITTAMLVAFLADLLLSRRFAATRPDLEGRVTCATTSSSSDWVRSAYASSAI